MTLKILIAGHGIMGSSYRKAFSKVQAVAKRDYGVDIELCGIADKDPKKTENLDVAVFSDYQNAITQTQPDIVINALNDDQHFDFFRFIETTSVKGVISEKPFTETLDEAIALAGCFEDRFLSLNLVENYSEIIPVFEQELARRYLNGYELIGIEGVWGKDRTQDKRPTQGIISDMIHPMGLFQRIFGVENFKTWGGQAVRGALLKNCADEAYRDKQVKFEHYVEMTAKAASTPALNRVIPIRLDSSYAWRKQDTSAMNNAQDRRVTGFYKKGKHDIRVVEFTFDSPFGGADTVRIYKLGLWDKKPKLLTEKTVLNQALNGTIIDPSADLNKGGKAKLYRFLLDSIVSFAKPALTSTFNGKRIIGYDAAIETQTFLEEIDNHARLNIPVLDADPIDDKDAGFRKTPRFKPVGLSQPAEIFERANRLQTQAGRAAYVQAILTTQRELDRVHNRLSTGRRVGDLT